MCGCWLCCVVCDGVVAVGELTLPVFVVTGVVVYYGCVYVICVDTAVRSCIVDVVVVSTCGWSCGVYVGGVVVGAGGVDVVWCVEVCFLW